MLDLLEVVNAKSDKASVGQQAANIERHPERRFKAAYAAYEERELPKLKVEVSLWGALEANIVCSIDIPSILDCDCNNTR
jgi:hypothetical protein